MDSIEVNRIKIESNEWKDTTAHSNQLHICNWQLCGLHDDPVDEGVTDEVSHHLAISCSRSHQNTQTSTLTRLLAVRNY
jgi:hypothetical protein